MEEHTKVPNGEEQKNPVGSKEGGRVEKKWNLFRVILTILVTLTVMIIVGYFLKASGLINSKEIFTTYKPLQFDTLLDQKKVDSISMGKTAFEQDSITDTISTSYIERDVDKGESTVKDTSISAKNKKGMSIDFLEVNTDYSHALNWSLTEAMRDSISDLFIQLIMPTEKERKLGDKLLGNNQFSYTTVLKMLSVVACDILVQGENLYNQQLIRIITENEYISDIFIVNRNGIIVNSTHSTRINQPISLLLNSFDVNSNIMKNIETGERNYLSIPLYYTYGLIGQAVIAIEKERTE